MPIVQADIKFYESNDAGSLGGAIKLASEITSGQLHNLFDKVSGSESAAGDVEYRCFYARNEHGTLTLEDAVAYILSNTPSAGSAVHIGIGTSGVNGIEQSIADEETAPAGVTFSDAVDLANALAIGNIPAGQHIAIWVRRTISAGATAHNNDNGVIRINGDTAA